MYSRITGYYRPVKNWNAGKTQEYKERKLYVPENSVLTERERVKSNLASKGNGFSNGGIMEDGVYLFTTKTCPNCKMAKGFLETAGVEYTAVDAEDNLEMTKLLNVNMAPTLVVVRGEELNKYNNASDIKRYLEAK